jgi:heme-degrading monooxygenase HmoA
MHGRIGIYTADPAKIEPVIEKAKAELPAMMRGEPGLRRYAVIRAAPGELVSMSAWETAEQAEAGGRKLVGWVRQNAAEAITGVENHLGEIAFSEPAGGPSSPFVRVALYQFKPGKTAGVVAKAHDSFLPILRQQPGFVRYTVADLGGDRAVSISGWRSKAEADAAVAKAADWVKQEVASDVQSVKNYVGELLWSAD